jgi:uncharacterized protein YdeI (YjbR/CyaY-like superfamily)
MIRASFSSKFAASYTQIMEHKGTPVVEMPDSATWRAWLAANGTTTKKVWLRMYKKETGIPTIVTQDAVDDAICFGWIDSLINKFDNQSFVLYFAPRNPKSNWSRVNKEKVARLIADGKMTPIGLAMIETAKKTGTWTALDDVENGVVPSDLQAALYAADEQTRTNFEQFLRSFKRGLLEMMLNTKGAEARARRIEFILGKAERNEKRM